MARKQSEEISEKQEILRTEIKTITENDDAGDDEIARGDVLLAEFDELEVKRQKALEREAKVDEVMRAALNPGNREGNEGRSYLGNGPQVKRTVDPYDEGTYKMLSRSTMGGGKEVANFEPEPVISRAMAAVEQTPRFVSDDAKQRMTELLELDNIHAPLIARHMLMTGSAAYRDQFNEYMRQQGTYAGDLLRTAMSLTDANGGFLVPFFLDPTIILTSAGVASSIRASATVKTIATKTWEGVTSAGVTTAWTAEGVETGDGTPTYLQPSITPKKADAWVFGSYEVFEDSGFSSELTRLLADAKYIHDETAFATANTGATRPRGVVAAVAAVTASIVTSATTGAFVIGDVYNVADAVQPRFAEQATWLGNKKIFSKIRQFDTSGGGGFWANLGMGRPAELLGQPAKQCSPMTSTVGNGTNILLVGDLAQYYIVDRVGMSVIYDPLIRSTGNNRPTGQAGWYAHWRVGADVVNADAFRLLQLNQVAAATALA